MEFNYRVGGSLHTVRVEREGDGFRVSIDGGPAREVHVAREDEHTLRLQDDLRQQRVRVASSDGKRWAALDGFVYELQVVPRGQTRAHSRAETDAGSLQAQMPGQVVSVAVKAGQDVQKGQTLVILEAMKMEVRVQAPHAGQVKRVLVEAGQVVERGQQLVELAA